MSILFIANNSNTKIFTAIKKALEKISLTNFSYDAVLAEPTTVKNSTIISAAEESIKLLFQEKITAANSLVLGVTVENDIVLSDYPYKNATLEYCVLVASKDLKIYLRRIYVACTLNDELSLLVQSGKNLINAYEEVYGKKIRAQKISEYEYFTGNKEELYLEEIVAKTISFFK